MFGRESCSDRLTNRDGGIPNGVEWLRKGFVNFLAHLLTGDSGDEMLLGSFAGDFCRGSLKHHPIELQRGIRLHRKVDAFAERHPAFSAVRAMLRPSVGLYAAVAADMLIDHVLAREWHAWGRDEALTEFASRTGAVLTSSEVLPGEAARVARIMIQRSWLESYASLEGIRSALGRMNARTRGRVRLEKAATELEQNHDEMTAAIRSFLGDLLSAKALIAAGMPEDLGR